MFLAEKYTGEAPALKRGTLSLAGDYLDQHGHCQGRLKDAKGRVCLLGAVGEIVGFGHEAGAAIMALRGHLGTDPVYWNNIPGRTKNEVVAALRDCACSP